jgi:hypothetical protein
LDVEVNVLGVLAALREKLMCIVQGFLFLTTDTSDCTQISTDWIGFVLHFGGFTKDLRHILIAALRHCGLARNHTNVPIASLRRCPDIYQDGAK